jgi:hypothetical protein
MMARTFGPYRRLRRDDVMSAYLGGIDGGRGAPRRRGESISAQSASGL